MTVNSPALSRKSGARVEIRQSATVCLLHLAFLENNNEQHVETNEVFCKEFDRHDISCTLSPHSL